MKTQHRLCVIRFAVVENLVLVCSKYLMLSQKRIDRLGFLAFAYRAKNLSLQQLAGDLGFWPRLNKCLNYRYLFLVWHPIKRNSSTVPRGLEI